MTSKNSIWRYSKGARHRKMEANHRPFLPPPPPPGSSVNDGIDQCLCSLRYTSVKEVATVAAHLGRGTLLVKVDIESAYRLIPVHPDDRWLLGTKWENLLYIDPMLPFGLRSSAKIFNAVADAFEWRLKAVGVPYVYHYLDDFTVLGAPRTDECSRAVSKLHIICSKLGIPLATHKSEGPAMSITFLGIVTNTVAEELRLPAEKLDHLRTLLVKWGDKKACTRRDLESLIGHLNHACKVVRPGRSFLRRMIDLLHHCKNAHYIRLSRGFRSDLQWWKVFATTWNGTSYLASNTTAQFASDASGTWDCGAWHGTSWFQWRWGRTVSRPRHPGERTTTHHPGSSNLGASMAQSDGAQLLRQSSSRGNTAFVDVQAARFNAHAALPLLR